jgi:hypothetical protein
MIVLGVALMKNAFDFGMAPVLTSSYRSGPPQTEVYNRSSTMPASMSRFGLFHKMKSTGDRSPEHCLYST